MPQLWRHPKTGGWYYRKVVPEPLRKALGRREFRRSLDTKDHREAKLRYPAMAAQVDALLQAAAEGAQHLTHKEVVALAGEWYRRKLERSEDEPGEYDSLVQWEWALQDVLDECKTPEYRQFEWETVHGGAGAEPTPKFRSYAFTDAVKKDVDQLLLEKGLVVDEDSRRRLSEAVIEKQLDLYRTLQRRAKGDYGPDRTVDNLPPWTAPERPLARGKGSDRTESTTLSALIDPWVEQRRPTQRTARDYRRKVAHLRAFLGHEDAERITKRDLIRWKDQFLQDQRHPKTAKNHIDVVHGLFQFALDNDRLKRSDNPAKGIKVDIRAKPGDRRKPFSLEDARAILVSARAERGALRWVPWLLAYTGARLAEVCQAHTGDIREMDGICYLDINAEGEGKSVKNIGSLRKVPLHRALIDEGFLEYVKSLAAGPLFPDVPPGPDGNRGNAAGKRIGRLVRAKAGIRDPKKAPSHSFRHLFKDLCRDAEIEKAVSDALTGHASTDVGDKYGSGFSLKRLHAEINKIPPFDIVGGIHAADRRARDAA